MRVVIKIPYDQYFDNGKAYYLNTPDGSTGAELLIGDLKEMGYKAML
jgi:hypothetical protein